MDHIFFTIPITNRLILILLTIPIGIVISYLLEKKIVKGRNLSIVAISTSLVAIAWAFTFANIPSWTRDALVTYSSVTLSFWITAKANEYVEYKKFRQLMGRLSHELLHNLDIMSEMRSNFSFKTPEPHEISFQATYDRFKTMYAYKSTFKTITYEAFINSGLTRFLPSDEMANTIDEAFNRINYLRLAFETCMGSLELK